MSAIGPPIPGVEIGSTMAIPVATGEVVQVLVQGVIEEQECENVWYFRAQAVDPDMLAHLLVDIAACLLPLIPILAPTYRLERLKAKIVSPAIGLEEEWIPDGDDTVNGAASGDARSSHESALISLRTTRPGRTGRGRVYLAGVPENGTVGSQISGDAALWTALLTFCACMLDKFKHRDAPVAGNYEWGVMSRKIGGVKPPFTPAGFAPIISAKPSKYLATTRSRKVGRGR